MYFPKAVVAFLCCTVIELSFFTFINALLVSLTSMLCVCFSGVSEAVRDVSAILTRDVVRASPTSHNVLGGVGEEASRDVARGLA